MEFTHYLSIFNSCPESIKLIFVVIIGLIVGSYLNVVIVRGSDRTKDQQKEREYVLEHYHVDINPNAKKSVFENKRSVCPTCGNQLKWYHNIPVISYIALKGKCAFCKKNIPATYVLVELVTSAIFSAILIVFDFELSARSMLVALIASLSIVIAMIDYITMTIKDKHSALLVASTVILVGLSNTPINANITFALISVLALYLFASVYGSVREKITGAKLTVMGEGDYPLFFVGALNILSSPLASSLNTTELLACGIGLITLIHLLLFVTKGNRECPLAPAILIANLILLLCI